MRDFFLTSAAALGLVGPAPACELALMLAVDVSGSVDPAEYRVQMQGLADALQDPVVSEVLVKAQAQVAVVQWTGSSRQQVTLGWRPLQTFADLDAFAAQVEAAPRRWRNFSTAIGEALQVSANLFDHVPTCTHRVIDVSSDGISNEGIAPRAVQPQLTARGITVNALVIEGAEDDLTGYFWENVIWGVGAFAVTANGFDDYPAKIRLKLRQEVAEALARAPVSLGPMLPQIVPTATDR